MYKIKKNSFKNEYSEWWLGAIDNLWINLVEEEENIKKWLNVIMKWMSNK